jgi:EmrB/QacA subfamily drug resistance transporter
VIALAGTGDRHRPERAIGMAGIRNSTGAPLETLEWVVLAYLLAVTGTLLVFGRIADVHGKRRIYMAGQVLFAVGSLLCGVSGRIGPLVASRVVQGLGASMVLALSPAVLIGAFPAEERGRALGLQATMTYLGLSIGPALGGWLTEHLGWPAIFLVNVPIGLAMVTLSSQALVKEALPEHGSTPPFDVAGAALMAAALSALLFALSHGQRLGWTQPLIAGLLAVSAAGWVAFVMVERRTDHPALDVGLFSSWTFSASTLAAFLCYCCMAAINLTAPFLLIRACGLSASHAGLVLMAVPLAMLASRRRADTSRTASAYASPPPPGWSRSARAPSCSFAWRRATACRRSCLAPSRSAWAQACSPLPTTAPS